MKFITYISNLNTLANARVLGVNENREAVGERNESIEGLLRNPLSFSLADVSALSGKVAEHQNKLTGKEQHLFSKLINYHLARLQKEGETSKRSRTLFAIFRQPGLSQFLTPTQRKSVEIYLTQERKDLEKLASEDPKKWTTTQAIRLARSYRFVRNRLNTVNLKIDKSTQNTGDKLKLYAATLAEKETLDNKDKLFVIELRQVFSASTDWKDQSVWNFVSGNANQFESDFKAIIEADGNIPADAQAYWDVLIPTATDSPKLVNFLTRSAEVESLQSILEKDKGSDNEVPNNVVPMLLSIEEYTFLQQLQTNEADNSVQVSAEAAATVTAAESTKAAAETEHQALVDRRAAEETTLNAKTPQQLKENAALSQELKDQYQQAWEAIYNDVPTPVEGEDPPEPSPALAAYNTWKTQAVKAILNSNTELSEEAIAAKKAKVDEAQTNITAAEAEKNKLDEGLEIYRNPSEKAAEMLENHAKYFKARAQSGRLLATDLDLIAHLGDDTEAQENLLGTEFEQTLTVLNSTRSVIKDALQTEFNVATLTELSEQDLDSVDKFLSYEAVITRIAETKSAGQTNSLLEAFETLEADALLDARQVVGSVVTSVRQQILEGITNTTTRESASYNNFLDNYTRQHHAINKDSRVAELLSFSENIERRKRTEVSSVHEHAYEKVSSLFENSDEDAVLSGLNKILKTEISAESVLNEIQGFLPESGFIHNASDGEIKNIKTNIVNSLTGKVTALNDDPAHLKAIADDLLSKLDELQAAQNAKQALQVGVSQLEKTDEDNISVNDRLELAKRTQLIHLEVQTVDEEFKASLMKIQTALEKNEDADALIINFLRSFDVDWKPRLETLSKALIAEIVFYADGQKPAFAQTLERAIAGSLTNLTNGVGWLKNAHLNQTDDVKIRHTDEGFKNLVAAINSEILPKFDLLNGTLAEPADHKINSSLEQAAHTHKYVKDELGLLKPEGAEKAKKAYKDQLKKYQLATDYFKRNWEATKTRLQKDLKKYTEEEFSAKHQMSKKQAYKIIKNNNERGEDADWMMDYFSGRGESPYRGSKDDVFNKWLTDYEDPQTQPAALKFMKNFKEFKDLIGKEQENFAGEASEMGKFVKDYDANRPTLFFKKKYKLKVEWYSLKSIYMMTKQAWEAWGKKNERQNDRMAAALGSRIFGDTRIGREFGIDANKKESERVGEFKESFGDKDRDYLFNRINKAKTIYDKDEARAAIELLMEKGELRWDTPELLSLLGRLQGGINFNLEEDMRMYVEDPAKIKQKIGQAVTDIWDRPTWLQWKADLPSKYKSQVESHKEDYREEVQKGSVDTYLSTVLEQWEQGIVDTNFERSKFESYIRNAFDSGEMNGYPNGGGGDRRWYYLIKGLTLRNPNGDTILGIDTLSRLGELQNKMPFMDAFDDSVSWKKDGKVVAEGTPGARQVWGYDDFQCWGDYFKHIPPSQIATPAGAKAVRKWLNETLLTTNDSQDRMGKVQLTGVDRDDSGVLPLLISADRLRDGVFRYLSGDKRPVDDKYYVNLLCSFENNFEDSVEYIKTVISENKDAIGYEDRKKKELLRFGETMKTYFMISQMLAGNWDSGGSVGAVTLSDPEWRNNDGDDHYQNIVKNVGNFLGGTDGDLVKDLKDKHYRVAKSEVAKKEDQKKGTLSQQSKDWENINRIFIDKDRAFSNIDRIETFIESLQF